MIVTILVFAVLFFWVHCIYWEEAAAQRNVDWIWWEDEDDV